MTRSWERNINGLRAHAQQKTVETVRRAEAAITQLLKEQRPVNFKTVAETAGISTAWLYGNAPLRQRIIHLRQQQTPAVQVKIPPREQASSASKDAMITALQKRVHEQAAKIKELEKQLEVAYGSLYRQ
jgi:Family of unknown function (DUF6262)